MSRAPKNLLDLLDEIALDQRSLASPMLKSTGSQRAALPLLRGALRQRPGW